MAVYLDALRGDGLAKAHRALAGLVGDPQRLDRARTRFDASPPAYNSDRSGTTTRSQSPNPLSEEQQRWEDQRTQVSLDREASKPHRQFAHQLAEEEQRIWKRNLRLIPVGSSAKAMAEDIVRKRWDEQGIWNSKWHRFAYGRWKHEEPIESAHEANSEVEPSPSFFAFAQKSLPNPRQIKSDEAKQQIAQQEVAREHEREASRPYYQFVYQISTERERILEDSEHREDAETTDINTKAYNKVKNAWTEWGIWNQRWGVLPGMSWKHEQPFEDLVREELGEEPDFAKPLANDAYETAPIQPFEPPSVIQPSHHQVSGYLNTAQQALSAEVVSGETEVHDVEGSSSALHTPLSNSRQPGLREIMGQALPISKRKTCRKKQQSINTVLGPIHPSKVSKIAGKSQKPQLPSSPGLIAVRRSPRTRPPVPAAIDAPTSTPRTNRPRRVVRSNSEPSVAGRMTARSSATPQGVTKKRTAKKNQPAKEKEPAKRKLAAKEKETARKTQTMERTESVKTERGRPRRT